MEQPHLGGNGGGGGDGDGGGGGLQAGRIGSQRQRLSELSPSAPAAGMIRCAESLFAVKPSIAVQLQLQLERQCFLNGSSPTWVAVVAAAVMETVAEAGCKQVCRKCSGEWMLLA